MWPQETLHAATAATTTAATSGDVDAATAASTGKDGLRETVGLQKFRELLYVL